MTLDKAKKGEKIEILRIEDAMTRSLAIRLGIGEGSLLYCIEIMPAGPVILQNNLQEVAVGRKLAQKIKVTRIEGSKK